MKKILMTVIALILLSMFIAPVYVSANAPPPLTFTVGTETARPNDSNVIIPITVTNNPGGLAAVALTINYDSTNLRLDTVHASDSPPHAELQLPALPAQLPLETSHPRGPGVRSILLMNLMEPANWGGNGVIAYLNFTVRSTASAGFATVNLSTTALDNFSDNRPAANINGDLFPAQMPLGGGITILAADHLPPTPDGEFRVTFNANNGSVSPAAANTVNGRLATLPTPTRSGHTFTGWFTAATGGTAVTTSTVFDANTTIYAHWTTTAATTRLLHTDPHGGTGGPRFPSEIPLTEWIIRPTTPRPTRANHEFAGWSLTLGGNVVDRVPAGTGATATNEIILHANWTRQFISVTDIPIPATPIQPGQTIPLVDLALPRNATNRYIEWDVINPGPTGAEIIAGNSYSFTAPREGTAIVQATVINGTSVGGVLSNFTERFEIIVASDGGTGTTPGGTAPGDHPGTTAPPAGVTRPSGAGNLTILDHFGTWTGRGTRTARVDADHNTFQRLWFGDRIVMPTHLTIASGSTSITLSEAFIMNLRDGTYSFVAEFTGGHATLNLIVSRAFGAVPQTGVADITPTAIIMGISLFLTLTMGVLLFFHLRAKRSSKYIGFDSGGVTIEKVRSRSNE